MTDTEIQQPAEPSAPADTPPPPEDNRSAPALVKSPSQQVRDAARALVARRKELRDQAAAPAVPPAASPTPELPPQEVDAAQPQAEPGEVQEADPAVEPPIDPPRAWKAEDRPVFESLPRDVQLKIAENEREREAGHAKRLQETSGQQKAYEAAMAQMQDTSQRLEQGLNSALQMAMTNNEFADIRSMEDVEQLANNDWPRWVRYQTHQQKVGMLQQQLQETQQQNFNQQVSHWTQFADAQDTQFSEKFPDAKELKEAAVTYLKDTGFSRDEIARYWNSAAWRDHRMQGVILDAVRYRQAKAKAQEAIKQPAPAVKKPGVSAPKQNPFQAEIANLEAKGALSFKEGVKLSQLRMRARQV